MTRKKQKVILAKDIRQATGIGFVAAQALAKAILSGQPPLALLNIAKAHDTILSFIPAPLSDDKYNQAPVIVGSKGTYRIH